MNCKLRIISKVRNIKRKIKVLIRMKKLNDFNFKIVIRVNFPCID